MGLAVMTALAWNLKAWWALTLPEQPGRWRDRYRAEKQWILAFADQVKDLAQGAVEKVEELVKVTATKIKDVVA